MRLINLDSHIEDLREMQEKCSSVELQKVIGITIQHAEKQPIILDTTQAPTFGGNLDLLPHRDVVEYCNSLYMSLVLTIKERDKLLAMLMTHKREAKKEE
jgi:hypothetical protein